MSRSLTAPPGSDHAVLPDIGRPRMAKANVQIPDVDWMARVAGAIAQAVRGAGWSHKEAAAKLGVDDAELGKWLSGSRRPQLDRLLACEALREPLIVALAGLTPNVTIETQIRFSRSARSA